MGPIHFCENSFWEVSMENLSCVKWDCDGNFKLNARFLQFFKFQETSSEVKNRQFNLENLQKPKLPGLKKRF